MAERTLTRKAGRLEHARRLKGAGRGGAAVAAHASLLWRRIGWIALAAMWVFAAASMAGFDPADPPSPAVAPSNNPVVNWCGRFGAVLAYYGFEMFGHGLWILLSLGAILLYFTVAGRRIGHIGIRILGGIFMASGVAGLQALIFPSSGPVPGLGGGLIGTIGERMLYERFSGLGTLLWLMLAIGVGAIVALDVWALIAAMWAGRAVISAGRRGGQFAAQLADMHANYRAARPVEVRLNDVDDDDELPGRARLGGPRADGAPRASTGVAENAQDTADPDREDFDAETDEPATESTRKENSATPATPSLARGAPPEDEPPGAPQVYDPAALREKMSRLPVIFAGSTKRTATDEDLRDIQNTADLEGYRFPGLDLLENPEVNFNAKLDEYVREQAGNLERALKEYRIDGEVVGIQSGPVITLYEIRLAPGTKVAALFAVASDLARSLRAVNIRIVPNTVGRDTVGIEVPNAQKEKVRLKELMTRLEELAGTIGPAGAGKLRLPMFLGKDASGAPLIEDLTRMPHLLIAGTTGSGKSVCMNSILMSFLYTKKPNELKLVLVDPKMVELSQFKDIPHLMCPVVTEMARAAAILEWAVRKMDERYELLAEAGCRDIAAYNELPWDELKERFNPATPEEEARIPRKLPYMVFVVDELADLIMTNKEVEGSIVRIAQKARAVGIHLIVATQRPQANVVTGLIKSNMPGRICFKVASGMDSRIVMDQKGGELLLGQGDMLYLSPTSHKLNRAQGTLVDDKEIRRVVKFMREVAEPTFERSLMQIRTAGGGVAADGVATADGESTDILPSHDGIAKAQADPLFEKAVEIVLETQKGSVSMLQRRLAIGYTRSARLMDALWKTGIVGNHKGTVDRDVLITPGEWEAMKAQAAADAAANGEGAQAALFEDAPPSLAGAPPPADAAAEEEALRFHDEPEPAHNNGTDRAPF